MSLTKLLVLHHSFPNPEVSETSMPTIHLPHLIRPDVISRMKRTNIRDLLAPFADYFSARNAPLDVLESPDAPLINLIEVLAIPDSSTPCDLVERLELLDLICDPASTINFEDEYPLLVERYRDESDTAADLAVKILLHAPEIAWREFDRQALKVERSFQSYHHQPSVSFYHPDYHKTEQFCKLAGSWFKRNVRSDFCRLHVRQTEVGLAFIIRHGDLLKRLDVLENDQISTSKIIRPERVDVAHYHCKTGEWLISGVGKKLQRFYSEAFGLVFHGDKNALLASKRYTLFPLLRGNSVLACDPTSGVQHAELKLVRFRLPCGQEITIAKKFVMEELLRYGQEVLANVTLIEARISFKLALRKRRVLVRILPLADKVYGMQSQPAIDAWLIEKEFAKPHHAPRLLESA